MKMPLVTIGVASFNNAPYLEETLESIRLQTYPCIELLIVDDCSRDGSVKVAKSWLAAHPEVNGRIICHDINMGVCRVCNDIVTQSQGDFISIIGSDDIFMHNKLTQQVPILLDSPPNIGVVFGDIVRIDASGKPIATPSGMSSIHSGNIFFRLLEDNFVPAMGTLVRRTCYERVGLFDETLSYEDWDMWLRIAREFEFLYVPHVVARYRVHNSSASFSRRVQMVESSLKVVQKHKGYNSDVDRLVATHTLKLAKALYLLDGPQAHQWLLKSVNSTPDAESISFLVLVTLGIPACQVRRFKDWVRTGFGLKGKLS